MAISQDEELLSILKTLLESVIAANGSSDRESYASEGAAIAKLLAETAKAGVFNSVYNSSGIVGIKVTL